MNILGRRRFHLPIAVAFAAASVASFTVLSDSIRQGESDLAGWVGGLLTGSDIRPIPGIGAMLVLRDNEVIIASVTYWCSLSTVLGTLFAGAALLSLLRRAPLPRLLTATLAAVVVVFLVNQIRLVSTVLSGREWGNGVMTTVHDYLGTPVSMLGFGIATFLLVGWAMGRRGSHPSGGLSIPDPAL